MSFRPIFKIKDWLPPITLETYNKMPVVKNGNYCFYKLSYKPVIFNRNDPGPVPHTYWELYGISNSDYQIKTSNPFFLEKNIDLCIENDEYYYFDEYDYLDEAILNLADIYGNNDIHHSGEYDKIFFRKTVMSKFLSTNDRAFDDIERLQMSSKDILVPELISNDNYKLSSLLEKPDFKESLNKMRKKTSREIDYFLSKNIHSIEYFEKNPDHLPFISKYELHYCVQYLGEIDLLKESNNYLYIILRNPSAGNILKKLIPDVYYNQGKYFKAGDPSRSFFKYVLYNLSQNPNCIEILTQCKFKPLDKFSVNRFIDWEIFLSQNTLKNFLYLKHLIDNKDTKCCFAIQGIGDMENFMNYLYDEEINEDSIYNFRSEYKSFANENGYNKKFTSNFFSFWKIISQSEIGFKMFEPIIREISVYYSIKTGNNKYAFGDYITNPNAYHYIMESLEDPENSEEMRKFITESDNVFFERIPNFKIFKLYYDFLTPNTVTINQVVKYCFLNKNNKWCDAKVRFLEETIEMIMKCEEYNKDPFDFWRVLFSTNYMGLLPFLNKYKHKIIPYIDIHMTTFYSRIFRNIKNSELHCQLLIEFIESNLEEIFNQDKLIPIYALYTNNYIYKIDKTRMLNQCKFFAEELAAYVFSPTRLQRIAESYNLLFEDLLELY